MTEKFLSLEQLFLRPTVSERDYSLKAYKIGRFGSAFIKNAGTGLIVPNPIAAYTIPLLKRLVILEELEGELRARTYQLDKIQNWNIIPSGN